MMLNKILEDLVVSDEFQKMHFLGNENSCVNSFNIMAQIVGAHITNNNNNDNNKHL